MTFWKPFWKLKYYMSSVTREVDKIEFTGCLFRLLLNFRMEYVN